MRERYVIRDGKVVRNGLVLGEGRYFGQEMLLTSYNHPLSVTTLTHMEGFVIRQQDLTDLLESGQFPRMRVRDDVDLNRCNIHLSAITVL